MSVEPGLALPLGAFTEDVRAVLGDDLVGLYLYGSAITGDFVPGVSDLDLLAVTARDAADLDLPALDRVHRAFVARDPAWKDRLEVVYVGRDTLGAFRTADAELAVISPGEAFHLSGPVRDWLQNWYLARETAITLSGEPVATAVPPIPRSEFVAGVVQYARWLGSRDPASLPPGSLAYTVLSLCRALRTVRTGVPCTKQEGARWVEERWPRWSLPVAEARRCRLAGGTAGFDDPGTRLAAAALIDWLAREIGRSAPP